MSPDADRWQRIEALCHEALARDPAERPVFLAAACADDSGLRREVEALVAKESAADGFLSTPLAATAAGAIGASSNSSLIGRTVGSYEILAALGAGGMGEVHRARDSRLGRDVAIKVLPAAFVSDRERLARFEREARVLAALNHPNIAAIYGVEIVDGARALVLELVEGDRLAERIGGKRSGLELSQSLAIARQIVDALEAAHEKSIVQRDLKPANIKITPAGLVKVLDFGLATVVGHGFSPAGTADAVPHDPRLSRSPTVTVGGTREGVLLGTAAYMSPEQARGQPVDKRADIWVFGCVLYELLTGRTAFGGATVSDHIAAILEREPDWSALPASAPAAIHRLLRRCLEKDPKRRLHDIADARFEIEEAHTASEPVRATSWRTSPRFAWSVGLLGLTGLTALAVWTAWTLRAARLPPVRAVTRFVFQPPASAPEAGGFDISPDGSQIVYAGREDGTTRLFLRRVDQFDVVPLAGTDGAWSPFFSADGEWVAFFAAGNVQKVNVRAPAMPIVLCRQVDAGNLFGAWTEDAVLFTGRNHGVQRVPAEGGEPQPLTRLDQSTREIDHHTPDVLPGGALLFAIHQGEDRFSIVVESPSTHQRKALIPSGFAPRYLPSGHIAFARGSAILAAPFDLTRLEVTGPPVTLVDHVATSSRDGEGHFALSRTGTLVFEPEQPIAGRKLAWVDRAGGETALSITARGFKTPRVSPNGKMLTFAVKDGDRHDIWTYDIASDNLTRVTSEGDNQAPLWTPDGQRLSYSSIRDDGPHLIWQPADGSGEPESLLSSRNLLWPDSWTADSRTLLYMEQPPTDEPRIFVLRLDEGRRTQPLVQGDGRHPSLSPDGHWVAFGSSGVAGATGGMQVYVMPFPGLRSRQQVTVDGGREVKWRRDGGELFYRRGRQVFSVALNTSSALRAGKPALLFEGPYVSDNVHGLDYDVAPDGGSS